MLTKYTFSKTCAPVAAIHRHDVDRESGVYVFFTRDDGRGNACPVRMKSISVEREYHDSWVAAKNALVAAALRAQVEAVDALRVANEWLANARALVPPVVVCHVCGSPMRVGEDGVSNHVNDAGIDHDRDADHVAYALD